MNKVIYASIECKQETPSKVDLLGVVTGRYFIGETC